MNKEPKLVFTKELPTKEGYYWWTNFGEHTVCILNVEKSGKGFYASNEEYGFAIEPPEPQQELTLPEESADEDEWREADGKDKYKFGDELWCYIPSPWLPNMTKQPEPDCY